MQCGSPLIAWLERRVAEVLATDSPASRSAGQRLTLLPVGHWSGRGSGATFLVFQGSRSAPVCVAKLCAGGDGRQRLRIEAGNLDRLARCGRERFLKTVPRVLLLEDADDRTLLIERVLAGRTMKTLDPRVVLGEDRAQETMGALIAWLAQFHAAFGVQAPVASARVDEIARRPIEEFVEALGMEGRLAGFIQRVRARAQAWSGMSFTYAPSHGDFCPSNILMDGRELGVIDFEEPLGPDLPCLDLLHFLCSCAVNFHPYGASSAHRRFEETFLRDNPFSCVAGRSVAGQAVSHGMAPEDLVAVFAVLLMRSALERIGHARKVSNLSNLDAALRAAFKPGSGLFATVTLEGRRCVELERLAACWEDLVFLKYFEA